MMRRLLFTLGGSPGVALQQRGDRDMEAWEGEGVGEVGSRRLQAPAVREGGEIEG